MLPTHPNQSFKSHTKHWEASQPFLYKDTIIIQTKYFKAHATLFNSKMTV